LSGGVIRGSLTADRQPTRHDARQRTGTVQADKPQAVPEIALQKQAAPLMLFDK